MGSLQAEAPWEGEEGASEPTLTACWSPFPALGALGAWVRLPQQPLEACPLAHWLIAHLQRGQRGSWGHSVSR